MKVGKLPCVFHRWRKVLSLALIWNDRLKTALRFNCFYNSTLWTIDWIFWTRKWVFNTASTPSQRTLGLQCCLKFRATWSRSCIIESVARCQGQSKHGTKLRCIRKLDIISPLTDSKGKLEYKINKVRTLLPKAVAFSRNALLLQTMKCN